MRILFIDTYYSKFLQSFRRKDPDVFTLSYKNYKKWMFATFFGTSDFYSYNLKKLGYLADDIVVNDEILQKKWA